ncbi:hypothetical protein LINPERHAP1_LOCUS15946, partial [Linum perenne]
SAAVIIVGGAERGHRRPLTAAAGPPSESLDLPSHRQWSRKSHLRPPTAASRVHSAAAAASSERQNMLIDD